MKAVYIIRPTKPRYEYIWDVADVLKYLKLLSPVRKLSLKDLSLKLIMLLALLTAGRCQSLVKLNLIHMKEGKSSVTFTILDVIKQSRPGFSNPLIRLEAFASDRRLCVITVLREYISRTSQLRGSETQLFVSYNRPHKAISENTISRWLRTVLCRAGIDITVFSAHSVRAATTSKAKSLNVPVDHILKTGGWSEKCSTFAIYYDKPIRKNENVTFSRILQS